MRSGLYLTMALSVLSQLQRMYTLAPAPARALLAAPALAPAPFGNATIKDALFKDGLGKDLNFFFFFFFFFLGGTDIHYTSAMIATSRVCDVHHKPKRPKLTTHLEWFRHES